jgi:hypothetical protein
MELIMSVKNTTGAAIPFEFARGQKNIEGAKMFRMVFDFSAQTSPINAQGGYRDIGLGTLSTVYIDNSANAQPFQLAFVGTSFTISVAKYTQGFYPVLSTPSMLNVVATSTGGVAVPVTFINKEMLGMSWASQ